MSHPIYRKYDLCVTLTPKEAAQAVCGMDDQDQAIFLAEMHRVSDEWETAACFQWQMVIDLFTKPDRKGYGSLSQEDIDAGRRFMRDWIEYFECVVNPTAVDYLEELQRENQALKDKLRAIREGVQGLDAPGAGVQSARVCVEPREGQEPQL